MREVTQPEGTQGGSARRGKGYLWDRMRWLGKVTLGPGLSAGCSRWEGETQAQSSVRMVFEVADAVKDVKRIRSRLFLKHCH